MFKAVMNNKLEEYNDFELEFDDTKLVPVFELSINIDNKLHAIQECKLLDNYFNNHKLDYTTLEVISKFNDSIKYLNVVLPSVESLDSDVYSTSIFRTELQNKIEIGYESLTTWWENFLKMLKRIWDYFTDKYKYYQESIENLGKELDNINNINFEFDTEKGNKKSIYIYNPQFVKKVIIEVYTIFNKTVATNLNTKEVEVTLIDINNKNIVDKANRENSNIAGFRYKRLSKELQVFKEPKKGAEEYTVTDVYNNFYKEGTKSEIYKTVIKLKNIMEMLNKNKTSLEAAINNQKVFDKRADEKREVKDKLMTIFKNDYETLGYVSNCILTIMKNYVSSAKSCLSCFKKK